MGDHMAPWPGRGRRGTWPGRGRDGTPVEVRCVVKDAVKNGTLGNWRLHLCHFTRPSNGGENCPMIAEHLASTPGAI